MTVRITMCIQSAQHNRVCAAIVRGTGANDQKKLTDPKQNPTVNTTRNTQFGKRRDTTGEANGYTVTLKFENKNNGINLMNSTSGGRINIFHFMTLI